MVYVLLFVSLCRLPNFICIINRGSLKLYTSETSSVLIKTIFAYSKPPIRFYLLVEHNSNFSSAYVSHQPVLCKFTVCFSVHNTTGVLISP